MQLRTIINSIPLAAIAVVPVQAHAFHADHVLGTAFDLVVAGADETSATRAWRAARAEIDRLDAVLSGWRADSELAALNRSSGSFAASADLFAVIAGCEAWRAACPGAFSGRMGAVEALWRDAEAQDSLPHPQRLLAAAQVAETAKVRLDPVTGTIDRGGVTFAVDAYAKGYIVDAALKAARQAAPGASGILADIGGDIACDGAAPTGGAWRVGVAAGGEADNLSPVHAIQLGAGAVATSGPGARDRVIAGKAYAHLLSPGTGQPSPARLVSVTGAKAADADALATALSAMAPDKALAFAAKRPGVEARIVASNGAVFTTGGWDRQASPVSPAPVLFQTAPKAAASRAWPAGFQVSVDYEIPLFGGRAKIPYVVIFITNEQGQLVRTLYHLGNRPPRFLDSNYAWRRLFDAKGGELASVTRPSRAPGKYNAVWDGKDDSGEAVPQGRYTINIEFSREHGGHSQQAIPLTLGSTPVSGTAAAQDEAGPATATYGKSQ